jgi:hypothetical protein
MFGTQVSVDVQERRRTNTSLTTEATNAQPMITTVIPLKTATTAAGPGQSKKDVRISGAAKYGAIPQQQGKKLRTDETDKSKVLAQIIQEDEQEQSDEEEDEDERFLIFFLINLFLIFLFPMEGL